MLLTDSEEIIPGCHKLLPERHVGPDGLGEEDDHRGEPKHFPHREDELLGFLGYHIVHAAHTGLKQHRTDPCIYRYSCYTEIAWLLWDKTSDFNITCTGYFPPFRSTYTIYTMTKGMDT